VKYQGKYLARAYIILVGLHCEPNSAIGIEKSASKENGRTSILEIIMAGKPVSRIPRAVCARPWPMATYSEHARYDSRSCVSVVNCDNLGSFLGTFWARFSAEVGG
jgi:hypothetical protein